MSKAFQDALDAIDAWNLQGLVEVKASGHRVKVIYQGEETVMPGWLAVMKINQIGVEKGV